MSNDKMRALLEECLEILQTENWRGDLQDGIWTVLTQQPESQEPSAPAHCSNCASAGWVPTNVEGEAVRCKQCKNAEYLERVGAASDKQPESEPVDDWLVYCLEYIGAGDPDDIECDAYELYSENDEGQSGTITVSISEACRKAATALQIPQPSAQVPDIECLPRYELNLCQGGIESNDAGQYVRFDDLEELIEEMKAAPSIAEKREWISCEERLPRPRNADGSSNVWVINKDGVIGVRHWRYVVSHGAALYTHWMPTGLQRPQPPEGE